MIHFEPCYWRSCWQQDWLLQHEQADWQFKFGLAFEAEPYAGGGMQKQRLISYELIAR
jgi:hypothetical protein